MLQNAYSKTPRATKNQMHIGGNIVCELEELLRVPLKSKVLNTSNQSSELRSLQHKQKIGLHCGNLKELIKEKWKLQKMQYRNKKSPYLLFSFFQVVIASLQGNWTNLKNCCQNILTTMGRWQLSLLWRLDFKNFKLKKNFHPSHPPRQAHLFSTSMRYSRRLWHNILQNEMVFPN